MIYDDDKNNNKNIYISDRDAELRSSICSWNFAPFDYSTDELIQCAFIIIKYILALPDLKYITVKDSK